MTHKAKKSVFITFIFLSLMAFVACDNPSSKKPSRPGNGPGQGGNSEATSDASSSELAVLEEMNYARTKPKDYIAKRLEPLKSSYTGTKLSALEELISEMSSMSELSEYTWSNGLYKAAAEWVAEQGATEEIGHDSKWSDRIKKYCSCSGGMAENISYGYSDAKDIVIQLLVDDGVSSRGHRKNILSSSYTHVGAAIGSHKKHIYMCCIDFAGNCTDL